MSTKSVTYFAKRLFLFGAPLLIVIVFLEINIKNIANNYALKRHYFEQKLDSTQVLILGSSQAMQSVDPAFIQPPAFNLAMMSQTIFYDRRITEKYLAKMPHLKMVVIPISYFVLWYHIFDGKEKWRDFYYYHYWDINFPETKWYDIKKYSSVFLYETKNTLGLARTRFKSHILLDMHDNGWVQIDKRADSTTLNSQAGLKRVAEHNELIHPERFASICSDLDEMVANLRKNNIEVVFLVTPQHHSYSQFLNKTIVFKNDSVLNSMKIKYGALYYNYSSDSSFTDADFYDNDHLNKYGAEKFSKRIQHDIVDPYFRGDSRK